MIQICKLAVSIDRQVSAFLLLQVINFKTGYVKTRHDQTKLPNKVLEKAVENF